MKRENVARVEVHVRESEIRLNANNPAALRQMLDERFRLARHTMENLIHHKTGVSVRADEDPHP